MWTVLLKQFTLNDPVIPLVFILSEVRPIKGALWRKMRGNGLEAVKSLLRDEENHVAEQGCETVRLGISPSNKIPPEQVTAKES